MDELEGVPAVTQTLPPAAVGYGGGVLIVNLKRCWANRAYRATGIGQCPEKVPEEDDLGLCAEHREELASG